MGIQTRYYFMGARKIYESIRLWKKTLLYILGGNKADIARILLLGLLLNSFLSLAAPFSLKYLFDEGILGGNFKYFILISVSFVSVFTFWRLGMYWYRLYSQKVKVSIFKKHSAQMLDKYYDLPYGEVIKQDQGYYLSRVYDEVLTTVPPLIDVFSSLFNQMVTLVAASYVILSMSWRATLTVITAIPIVFALSIKYGGKIKRESKIEKEEEAKLRGVLSRAVGAYKIAKTFGLRSRVSERTEEQFTRYLGAYFQRFKSSIRYQTLSGMFMSYAETIAIIGAGYEIYAGRLTFGGYMGFMSAFWGVMGAIRESFNLVPELSRLAGQIERLKEFELSANNDLPVNYSEEVKLSGVTFSYNGKPILSGFDFSPRKGEKVLIVGSNGSGKSTLAHLLAGLLRPNAGEIATLPLEKVSAVIYPSDFIPGTIADNLNIAGAEHRREIYQGLIRNFELSDSLEKDTTELSAGQRKKVEIAMGLIKEADIYIFDEPLAGIDVESKTKVMDGIFNHTKDKTLVMVMHGDTEYHRYFDRIVSL